MSFSESFSRVIGLEGHYVNDPADAGGETMYGITRKTARRFGYLGDMRQLPLVVAQDIYRAGYWDRMRLDDVMMVGGSRIADELFECGVNIAPGKAASFLQRALNAFNLGGKHYADVVVDGAIGPATIEALRVFIVRRQILGERVMLTALNAQQGAYYLERTEERPQNESFAFGWFANRVQIA
jgi:lysozyme family protein